MPDTPHIHMDGGDLDCPCEEIKKMFEPQAYIRKAAPEVQAMQWNGTLEQGEAIYKFSNRKSGLVYIKDQDGLVSLRFGHLRMRPGDYFVVTPESSYRIEAEKFEAIYEARNHGRQYDR